MKQEDTKENNLTERVQFANKLQDELEKEYGVTMADCIYDYGNNSEKIKEKKGVTMTPEEHERIVLTGKRHTKQVRNTGESEIEILKKQKSKLIDMIKQLMSYEIPNTEIDSLYQQKCFKAAKKLLEEVK